MIWLMQTGAFWNGLVLNSGMKRRNRHIRSQMKFFSSKKFKSKYK